MARRHALFALLLAAAPPAPRAGSAEPPPDALGAGVSEAMRRIKDGPALGEPPKEGPSRGPTRDLALPELITQEINSPSALCAHAGKRQPPKRLVLVAGTSHVCDRDAQVCLKTLRDVSDPCNLFVHANFSVYHTRPYRYRHDSDAPYEEQSGADAIYDQWLPNGGPSFSVVDCADRSVLRGPRPGSDAMKGGGEERPAAERFRLMREQLLGIPGVSERLGAAAEKDLGEAQARCLKLPAPTVAGTWQAVDAQPWK